MTRETAPKLLIRGAEAVWAASKYWIMAVDQNLYKSLRELFGRKPLDLAAIHNYLQEAEERFGHTPVQDLPELSNALYHVSGYFKKLVTAEERQTLHHLIQLDQTAALKQLQDLARQHQVSYLIPCRLWERTHAFDYIPVPIKINGQVYEPYSWAWHGDYLSKV